MIGQTISHYKITDKLGDGGMGVVYKAVDTKLDRPVALKFLPPEFTRDPDAKRRFIHEAKAASALQHNNICTVHEIDETDDGQIFICMDCYEGETLKEKIARGPMPVEEAMEIIHQVAVGLSKAHEAGMVHRDVKPANIMITSDGVAKIVDFGLAKLAGQTKMTKTGATVGTITYMSPEQARGDEVDARSDLFSLGVVIYEALCGRSPFKGDHEAAVAYSIMNNEPEPLYQYRTDLPEAAQTVIDKALAKDRDNRYANATELLEDLDLLRKGEFVSPSKHPVRTILRRKYGIYGVIGLSIVIAGYFVYSRLVFSREHLVSVSGTGYSVLIIPLEVRGQTEGSDYAGMAFAEALAINLAEVKSLRILPVPDKRDIGAKGMVDIARTSLTLGANRVLTGALTWNEKAVTVNVSLIDAAENRLVWGQEEKSEQGNIAELAAQMAWSVVDVLELRQPHLYEYFRYLTGSAEMSHSPILLETVAALQSRNVRSSMHLTEQLVKEYPNDPEALLMRLVAVQDARNDEPSVRNRELRREAMDALAKVDPQNPHLDILEAEILFDEQRVEEAGQFLAQVLARKDITPGLRAYALRTRGRYHAFLQKPDMARNDMEEAIRLDPANEWSYMYLGWYLINLGDYKGAELSARKGLALNPSADGPWHILGSALVAQDRVEEAVSVLESWCDMNKTQMAYSEFARIMARAGKKRETMYAVERAAGFETTEPAAAVKLAWACALVGEDEMAVKYLKQAKELGYSVDVIRNFPIIAKFLDHPDLSGWK